MLRKISLFLVLFFINIISINASNNQLDSIKMDIYIDDYGTASVSEVWSMDTIDSTENYRVFGNLATSEVLDFTVTDESGTTYQFVDNWNINSSRQEKKYKNGIVYTGDGIELCWGIGDYGYHTYTLEYKITNFVKNYNDYQAIYFGLVADNMGNPPKDIDITIKSPYNFEDVGAALWGYGYEGIADFVNGNIVLKNTKKFTSSNYVVFLLRLPLNTFNTTDYINDNFNSVFQKAEEGVDIGASENAGPPPLFVILMVVGQFIFFFIIIVISIITYKKSSVKMKMPNINQINYFRDIPCNKDVFRAFVIGKDSALVKNNSSLIGAILLKWIKEKKVTFIEVEGGLFKKGDKNAIDLSQPFYSDNSYEMELYDMLKLAAKGNQALEKNEFSKWYMGNYTKVNSWFTKIEKDMKTNFENEGLITKETAKVLFIPYKKDVYTDRIKEEAIQFMGLKKFLKEFTLIKEKPVITVHLWEDYLIFAQLLGIADEVDKEFKKLYPEIADQININYNDIMYINSYVHIINTSNRVISSRSSGGGGFSSFGGGGGSFGGGSGGGSR